MTMLTPPAKDASPRSTPTDGLDDVYASLKERDAEWLNATLAERWRALNEPAVEGATQDREVTNTVGNEQDIRQRHDNNALPLRLDAPQAALWEFDVTAAAPPANASEHVLFVRSTDWAATELGPMSSWSVALRRLVNHVLKDPRVAAITYGESHTILYNEQYRKLAGDRHPRMMGLPMYEAWPEAKDAFEGSYHTGKTTGQGTTADNVCFLIERGDDVEEIWASYSNFPVAVDRGNLVFYNLCLDVTGQVTAERRMSTLLGLAECISAAKDITTFWTQAWEGLKPNGADIPFAALYSIVQSEDLSEDRRGSEYGSWGGATPSEGSGSSHSRQWVLQNTLGLPVDCPGLPTSMDSEQAAEHFTPVLRQALQAGQPTLLSVSDGTFPKGLLGVAKSREYGADCSAAVLCPVRPSNRDSLKGFVLIGINPRRDYDTDYEHFMQLLTRQMATSMASIVLIEEELRRSRIAAVFATSERLRLSERLAETEQLAEDSETRFRRMADLAPVGIFHTDAHGNVLYANRSWYSLTQHPDNDSVPMRWYDDVHEDDLRLLEVDWSKSASGHVMSAEVRLRKPFVGGEIFEGQQVEGHTWIIASAYAERHSDGTLSGLLGCFTEISRQKWAEEFQQRRVREAQELKRQQENFMDMISHEARNPLSAIILCTDSIIAALKQLAASEDDPVNLSQATLLAQLESAETIMTCAAHQKGIIDDVLTLSKLDSGLLLITPVEVQISKRIAKELKVFEIQLQAADVTLQYLVKDSYRDLGVDWVRLDPSRVTQILINLISNAIKFTQTQSARRITVTLDASSECPCSETLGVQYLTRRDTTLPAPKPGSKPAESPVYLSVAVQDTGRGLTEDEMRTLFQRFQQANPKTHVEYGGSGLGLFISRELVRLQGGQIGVASVAGKGSTFAFYIVAYPATGPELPMLPAPPKAKATQTDGSTSEVRNGTAPSQPIASLDGSKARQKPVEHLLIVEDNLVNQRVMSKQLRSAGYKVSVANHGVEALEHIRHTHFCTPEGGEELDVVLMDIEMPIMGGLECTRRIRAMQQSGEIHAPVPIIGVTANAREQQQSNALEVGMDLVVTKPFRLQELTSKLAEVAGLA